MARDLTRGDAWRALLVACLRRTLAACIVVLGSLAFADAATPNDDIDGRVLGANDVPEAGVWVIAETSALPTPYRKIVVTDDAGRFVVPDLPDVAFQVWVRGYGVADSAPVEARRGSSLTLHAQPAESAAAAAANYPASYWLSLLEAPADAKLPNGTPGGSRAGWVSHFKLGCQLCHQVGATATRGLTRERFDHGFLKASYMSATADGLDRGKLLDALAGWSARIAAGELPPAPPRPQGIERNMVITEWGWGDTFTYAHDEIATDKRDPTRYPHGPIYGVDLAADRLLALDPTTHVASSTRIPTLGGYATSWCDLTYRPSGAPNAVPSGFGSLGCPAAGGTSGYVGQYPNAANPHNPMFDAEGRVWITTQVRREWASDMPSFCHASPVIENNYHHRQLGWFDTKTQQYQLIDTCYGTHHLQFDANGVLWSSGDSYVLGWFDPAKYDPAKPSTLEAAQGWAEISVDTNGDGKADMPIVGFNYGVIPNPVEHTVWTAQPGGDPGGPYDNRGRLVRFDPATKTFETFVPPRPGSGPRGVDVDSKGVIWAAMGGSGHLARFDRSKCRQTWGSGDQCPEGWTLFRSPGPLMRTSADPLDEKGADFHYYLFVDQFDTLGLGKDVVVMNGTGSDSLLAFDQKTETFTVIRIPYPMNSYTRGLDGRIDDATSGWKGRGLWYTNGLDPIIHSEVQQSYVGHVQLRPDPLAR